MCDSEQIFREKWSLESPRSGMYLLCYFRQKWRNKTLPLESFIPVLIIFTKKFCFTFRIISLFDPDMYSMYYVNHMFSFASLKPSYSVVSTKQCFCNFRKAEAPLSLTRRREQVCCRPALVLHVLFHVSIELLSTRGLLWIFKALGSVFVNLRSHP